MSTVNSVAWAWPAEVLELARKEGIEQYLEPLREAVHKVFPVVKGLRVVLSRDFDPPYGRFLTWEIDVPKTDVETYLALTDAWRQAERRIVPNAKGHLFFSSILPVKE